MEEQPMLCEALTNWKRYDFGPTWSEVMTWLERHAANLSAPASAAGCEVHLDVGKTKPLDCCLYESHRKMVDVQLVLEGAEWMYIAPSEGLALLDPFDEQKDCGFHILPAWESARITLHPGIFALLFPWDAHMPLAAIDNTPAPIKKIVVKIPLSRLKLN